MVKQSKLERNMQKARKLVKELEKDYTYDRDEEFWNETEDSRIFTLKKRIQSLSPVERTVLLLYIHTGSESGTGKLLNTSKTPVSKMLKEIRKKLREGL